MMMAGAMYPPFSFFSACGEKRKRAVHGPKEKRDAGAEFDREGQIRPNAGVFSVGARKFGSLNPAAADSVPPRTALPQL